MDFDRNALQFYLDHEEETRVEREKFLNGEDVDLSVVPVHVYNSWVRSAAYGVNPYVSNVPTETAHVATRNTEQFLTNYRSAYRDLDFFTRYFQFEIMFFDRNGKTLTDFRSEINNPPALEQNIGTTSVSIALATQKPATCFGYQNYKTPHFRQFCLSSPVLDRRGELLGAITIMLPHQQLTQERYEQAISILEVLSVFYRVSYSNQDMSKGMLDLYWQMVPDMSEGVVLVDPNGTEERHNPAALTLMGLKEDAEPKAVISRLTAMIKNAGRAGKDGKKPPVEIIKKSNSISDIYLLKPTLHRSVSSAAPVANPVKYKFRDLIGESSTFLRAKNEAFIVAPTSAAVMLLGESGVGKELFAQSIHNASARKNGPFVAINCGAVSKDLLTSELFGYEPGAFTGASSKGKIGVMEAASGGTLFLDEVESMPLYHQAALLRGLSSGFIRRVGGVEDIPIDIRVISATKVDLANVGERHKEEWGVRFRTDLYYRLSTCKIHIPALREHREDIAVLTQHLINKKKHELNMYRITGSETFMDALYYYDWPGNIRELENVVERATIFMDPEKQVLTRSLLYPELLERSDSNRMAMLKEQQEQTTEEESALRTEEEMTIQRYLLQNDCNVKDTAEQLGISRQTLYRKIRSSTTLSKLLRDEKTRRKTK